MRSIYCQAWAQITRAQKMAHRTQVGNFDALDAMDRAVLKFAKSLVADPRKISAMKASCPSSALEVEQLVGSPAATKPIENPANDEDAMERWLSTLDADDIVMLENGIKVRKATMRKASNKKK